MLDRLKKFVKKMFYCLTKSEESYSEFDHEFEDYDIGLP